ncbi:MAG: tRNA preQ1(34) S-adenosylmethionine ribosyltransferase-isomerase QueA [Acidimicrobiales bacterium]|nr:tRNA preQ1(34) S-adenosylmethionine ribosyltransferase-isomerase QueA [Acidimicrobiales bacterium]
MGPDDFYYELPASAVAQVPLVDRSSARLLDATGGSVVHRTVRDLPSLLTSGDVLVVNDTRVLPARLRLQRSTGGAAEVLLLRPTKEAASRFVATWEALVRPSRKLAPGVVVTVAEDLIIEVGDDLGEGRRRVTLRTQDGDLMAALNRHGEVPLPPYLTSGLADPERYQTVFSNRPASAAAPTAGLHLTDDVLNDCRALGARVEQVELVVGLDTFRPVAVENLDHHEMHREDYSVPSEVLEACLDARRSGNRVVAVGTTTVRALESALRFGLLGSTDLFIRPPFDFRVVDVLMTNFHMPRSTLLIMLEAFAGPRWRDLYSAALTDGYRFLSFGDAMILDRDLAMGITRGNQ